MFTLPLQALSEVQNFLQCYLCSLSRAGIVRKMCRRLLCHSQSLHDYWVVVFPTLSLLCQTCFLNDPCSVALATLHDPTRAIFWTTTMSVSFHLCEKLNWSIHYSDDDTPIPYDTIRGVTP